MSHTQRSPEAHLPCSPLTSPQTASASQAPLLNSCVYDEMMGYRIDQRFKTFVNTEVLPGLALRSEDFWHGFLTILTQLCEKNTFLLAQRKQFQNRIDQWHIACRGQPFDKHAYEDFLHSIGYLLPKVGDFKIAPLKVDEEVALQAGPQLVVPLKNARFALNAVNARWGSLYDALYGSDAIARDGELAPQKNYNHVRGARVIAKAREFLDTAAPLVGASHAEAAHYSIVGGTLEVALKNGSVTQLKNPAQLLGYIGAPGQPAGILLCNHQLRFEIVIDRDSQVGAGDAAGIADIILESALTTIMDCEDSVAAVDSEDKIAVYRNWLGLCQGTLSAHFSKTRADGSKGKVTRRMLPDRHYHGIDGQVLTLPGRSLMFIRNVGHLMTTPLILDQDNNEVYEGIVDGVITSTIAMHDLLASTDLRNSRAGSIYIVKPKMHGPEEVAFTTRLFAAIESMLGLGDNTLKLGIMDEERRTTLNLKACIKQAAARCVFINTGFLDRTGDEIHTSMHAGPMVPKTWMKTQPWIKAYELWNVDTGLDCGFSNKAQIGKGMWAMPDCMHDMLLSKQQHLQAGASTAWVPSPTAATLHALHYHQVDVSQQQRIIANRINRDAERCFEQLLDIPLLVDKSSLTPEIIRAEIDNNCQGILGYVVRWVDQGIGCSKVLDIHNVGLMEDRATLRISSQLLANWLLHGICTPHELDAALVRMAAVVDRQNAADAHYRPMLPDLEHNLAFRAARELIFSGASQPNGYTEPLLHAYRRKKKLQLN